MTAPIPREQEWTAELGGIRIRFGMGAVSRCAPELERLGIRRPLIVTDPGVRAGVVVDAIAASLATTCAPEIFDGVDENPTTEHAEAAAAVARRHRADGFVGFGGGSAMDVAKAANFLVSRGGRMEDFEGRARTSGPMLPSLGIPTTAGTGSDAQSFALIARAEDHRKMACGDPEARFLVVLLDPALLRSVPAGVRLAAGLDALSHALESHVSRASTPISRILSREAWRRLSRALQPHLDDGTDPGPASAMMLGAHLAGAAIERSMLGAAHACANPLTARFDITHGIAVALMLPHVVRFNRAVCQDAYGALTGDLLPELLVPALLERAGIPTRLRDHGIDAASLPGLARGAAAQWTAGFNPRPVGEAELLAIYEQAY